MSISSLCSPSSIVGLGLTDRAQSLRELVHPRRALDWHWLPLVWAAFTFPTAVHVWWDSFTLLQEATAENVLSLLVTVLLLLGLLLVGVLAPRPAPGRVGTDTPLCREVAAMDSLLFV